MPFKLLARVAAAVTIAGPAVDGRTFSGRAPAGSTLTLSAPGVTGGTATASGAGLWSYTFGTAPGAGVVVTALGTASASVTMPGAAAPTGLLPVGARIANLGHSYEQFGDGGGSSSTAQPQISSNVRGPMVHLAALMPNLRRETWRSADARPSSSPRYFSGANHGLSGDTTYPNGSSPGLLSRVPEATAMLPHGYAVDIGVNDLIVGQTGAATVTRTLAILDALRAADAAAPVIILNVAPWTAGFGSDTATTRGAVVDYNVGLDAAVKARSDYGTKTFLVDAWGALSDGAPITAWAYGNAAYYYDTLHPTGLGSYKLGKAIQAVLAPLVTPGNYLLDSFWSTGNLFPTPVASAGGKTGTSVTDTVPTGLTVNRYCRPATGRPRQR